MLDKPDEAERNVARAKDLLRLEAPIHELASMAQIMADLLDDLLTGIGGNEVDEKNGLIRIRVNKEDMDNAAFAWCNVAARAIDLREAFHAAGKEGEGQ